ncbi:MAG: hypothetical protein IKG27_04450 [Bacilli bacterium]|nr:hypothetical protein [Bacilli bacterium]
MNIEVKEYVNNLLLYTILKNLIKCKLSDNKFIELEGIITNHRQLGANGLIEVLKEHVVKESVKTYEDYLTLINLCDDDNFDMWCDLTILSIELLLSKRSLLDEVKEYSNSQYDRSIADIEDKLSLGYDYINLEKPYGQRVVSALLVSIFTDSSRDKEIVLDASKNTVKNISELIDYNEKKYLVNVNNILMIVIDESVNQSIISTAGGSYEDRVASVLKEISDRVIPHAHDKFINSVEYDYIFELDGKLYGVNAKRTLRERYKQNFEDVNQLSVDAMFLVTLGTDLNQEKLNNIMQRHGYYVVVAQEVYDNHDYFKNNKRVISSKNFNAESLRKLFRNFF